MNAPAALLLGWKAPAVRELDRLGAAVTCVVEPAREVPDDTPARVVRCHDPADASAVVAALARADVDLRSFTHVLSAKEFPLVAAAVLAAAVRAHGMPLDTAVALRDKLVQKQRVRAAGVVTATTVPLRSPGDLDALTGSVVVKPVAGGGSHDTFVLRPGDAAAEHRARDVLRSGAPFVAETFVDGAELHADGVVRDGEVRLLTVARYLDNLIDVNDGGTVASVVEPAREEPALHRAVLDLTTRVLHAVGHRDGIFHLEAFETSAGLVFGECAGRAGGGAITHAFRLGTGTDLHRAWALAALGLPDTSAPPADAGTTVVGQGRLVAPPGATPPSTADVLARDGVLWAEVHPGPLAADPRTGSDVASGWAVVTAPDPAAARASLRSLGAWFVEAAR